MHTFHLPCDECTITLEDIQLQLGLPVDGPIVTGSIHTANWKDHHKNQNRWLHATTTIMGAVPAAIFTSSNGLPLYILTCNKYEFLPTREPIFTPELHGKSYLLDEDARGRPPHTRRPRRAPRNPRRGDHNRVDNAGPSFTLAQESTLMVTTPPGQYYTPIPLAFLTTTILTTTYRLSMFGALTWHPIVTPPVHWTQYSYTITPMVSQTPLGSLLYQGGPSLQPPIPRSEDT
ncbi:hypothetical protein Golob_013399 [Gossypium lobatum]|uniref:Aminotransferase-like plant mobile domain-containing protein n=1 Tax=Gossypium lobatum TaxID=34289 RepID=A0A7J8LPC9_9ROSI|nr:hypothetical protein [Gossypium lobatum]